MWPATGAAATDVAGATVLSLWRLSFCSSGRTARMRSRSSSVMARASSALRTILGESRTMSSVRVLVFEVSRKRPPTIGMSDRTGTPLR